MFGGAIAENPVKRVGSYAVLLSQGMTHCSTEVAGRVLTRCHTLGR